MDGCAQVRDARAARAEAGDRAAPSARSASSATARRTGRSARSRDQLREETDVEDVVLPAARVSVHDGARAFIDAHERVYVIEQNRDAQLLQLMKLELTPERQTKLRSVLHYNGLPIDARSITDDVLAQEGFEVAKKTAAALSRGGHDGWRIMATPQSQSNRARTAIYKGGKTTLCAGCGHNAISSASSTPFYEMGVDPSRS
jgi:hypothetical protein